uniref:Macroglobulin domain-containing protein n=1 Tax=Oryzias latipes TaxID=8090 RepID=A0A3P9L658_ORYLA
MALSGIPMWTWTRCLLFFGMLVVQDQVSGSSSSSSQSSSSAESCDTLLRKGTRNSFIKCFSFHVPLVEKCEIQLFEVTVEGQTVYSKEVKKVFIKTFKPKTFIQTDTAIYNPGQTGRYGLMMMIGWMKMLLFFCLYLFFLTDPHNIIIEQWVNQTPRRGILERSFQLSSGASEGYYRIVLKAGKDRFYQSFKVQKFSLPKFDIIVTIPKEISVGQKHFEVEVCAKYKCGKPVGGSAVVTVCRPVKNRIHCSSASTYKDYEHLHRTSLCTTKTKQVPWSKCLTTVALKFISHQQISQCKNKLKITMIMKKGKQITKNFEILEIFTKFQKPKRNFKKTKCHFEKRTKNKKEALHK